MPATAVFPANKKRLRRRRCNHTVLWVDDDPNITAAVTRRLRRHSIRVIPAADGMQGFWMALTRRPDAIVTDLRMPRWEGEELIECLRRNGGTRTVPTIVLSGYASDLNKDFRAWWGVDAVLDKPVDIDRLVAELKRSWKLKCA